MKRLMVLIVLVMASVCFATDIPVENPTLSLDGMTVTMQTTISGATTQPEIKIFWCNSPLAEYYEIQPYGDWLLSTGKNKTTISAMVASGWKLTQIIPYNSTGAKQFYLVFQK